MFGMPDALEERIDRLLDAGGVLNVREDQSFSEPTLRGLVVHCHASPAVKEQLGLRRAHWNGFGSELPAALAAAMYWMR